MNSALAELDLFWLEERLWVLSAQIDLPSYDFAFDRYFACRRPLYREDRVTAVARFGAIANYTEQYEILHNNDVQLLHSPLEHELASELTAWYPQLEDLTPRSVWFERLPSAAEIERHFDYPIFAKGSRQTNRHQAAQSIIRSRAECEFMLETYQRDAVLHWQKLVCREFIPLRPVGVAQGDKIPPSFEFRVFFWRGQVVGSGPYWAAFCEYDWNTGERAAALELATRAAQRLTVPFLVVDVVQALDERWLVIECNDAQECGYAGVNALGMWQRILELER